MSWMRRRPVRAKVTSTLGLVFVSSGIFQSLGGATAPRPFPIALRADCKRAVYLLASDVEPISDAKSEIRMRRFV